MVILSLRIELMEQSMPIKCKATEKKPATLTSSNDIVTGPDTDVKLKFEDRANEYGGDNKHLAHGMHMECP